MHTTPTAGVASHERGTALILSLFFVIIAMGVVMTGSIQMKSHRQQTNTQFQLHGQARQFARSGLTEALSWFRRQTTQPVLMFQPVVTPNTTPPIIDTIDEEVGIVREFRIAGSTWGRYEVWKEWDGDPNSTRLAWRQQMQVHDVSKKEGYAADGMSWRLRSIGYVFERPDLAAGVTQAQPFEDMRVISSQMLEAEILRLKISPPSQAALCIDTGADANLGFGTRIEGGEEAAGCYSRLNSGNPVGSEIGLGRVSGTPRLTTTPQYDASTRSVFGVSFDALKGVADTYTTDAGEFPSPVPSNTIVVAEVPEIRFTTARPLAGTGLVYVKGDVVIEAGSNSSFTGMLYVDGNIVMVSPCEILGSVVVTGTFQSAGVGDYATIRYDDEALNALRVEIGKYRLSGAIRPIISDD